MANIYRYGIFNIIGRLVGVYWFHVVFQLNIIGSWIKLYSLHLWFKGYVLRNPGMGSRLGLARVSQTFRSPQLGTVRRAPIFQFKLEMQFFQITGNPVLIDSTNPVQFKLGSSLNQAIQFKLGNPVLTGDQVLTASPVPTGNHVSTKTKNTCFHFFKKAILYS